jgi:pimeloyl-ACP methyl ester carboxylesterase
MQLHTRVMGTGPRVLFVHGSLTTSRQSWEKQEPLAERWTLAIPDRRGYAPNAVAERSDFEEDAADIAPLVRGEPAIEELIAAGDERKSTIDDPYQYMRAHIEMLGAPVDKLPNPLPEELERQVLLLMNERPPWELVPSASLAAASFPKLVVTGGHSDALELCSDAIADHLGPNTQRFVMTGRGHVVARLGQPFNDLLERFWVSADNMESTVP